MQRYRRGFTYPRSQEPLRSPTTSRPMTLHLRGGWPPVWPPSSSTSAAADQRPPGGPAHMHGVHVCMRTYGVPGYRCACLLTWWLWHFLQCSCWQQLVFSPLRSKQVHRVTRISRIRATGEPILQQGGFRRHVCCAHGLWRAMRLCSPLVKTNQPELRTPIDRAAAASQETASSTNPSQAIRPGFRSPPGSALAP